MSPHGVGAPGRDASVIRCCSEAISLKAEPSWGSGGRRGDSRPPRHSVSHRLNQASLQRCQEEMSKLEDEAYREAEEKALLKEALERTQLQLSQEKRLLRAAKLHKVRTQEQVSRAREDTWSPRSQWSSCPSVQRQVPVVSRHLRGQRGATGCICPDDGGTGDAGHSLDARLLGRCPRQVLQVEGRVLPSTHTRSHSWCDPEPFRGQGRGASRRCPFSRRQSWEGMTCSSHLVAHSGEGGHASEVSAAAGASPLAGADTWVCSL